MNRFAGLVGVRLHKVDAWLVSKDGKGSRLVYTQQIAAELFAEGYRVEYLAQYRVCVLDRKGETLVEGVASCYMCNRGQ